jgi:hypothetical protein
MEILSPFVFHEPVIPPVFAGRDSEIQMIDQILFKENESIALYGNDAIGKSSIINTIKVELAKKKTKIFPIEMNVFDFKIAIELDFLSYITQQICSSIWTDIMENPHSSLVSNSLTKGKRDNQDLSEENTIKNIYRIVTSVKLSGIGKESAEIGGKFFIEGKTSYEYQVNNERRPLATFEFLKLIDELIGVINRYGYESILLTCDEMNHLPSKTNTEFLRTYFKLFSSRNIKFLITVINPDERRKEDAKLLLDSFNHLIEINPFRDVSSVKELVLNVLQGNQKVNFSKNAFRTLFTITNGHPWWIQKICDSSFKDITRKGKDLISSNTIEKQSLLFKHEIEIYENQMKKGEPFLKYHLNQRFER